MKRLVVALTLLLVVGAGVGTSVSRWYGAAFPDLAPGTYAGVMTFKGSRRVVPWVVVRRPGEQSLSVAVGTVTMAAQQATPVDPLTGARQALFVGGQDVRFRFVGALADKSRYEGDFLNPISHEEGRWWLMSTNAPLLQSTTEANLTRWFSLWQELERIEGTIQQAQRKVDEHAGSIENLHRVVLDEDSLRKSADVRLGRADSEMEAARNELRIRQQQLDRKLRDFDLTQRVSKSGRLVFLSRETIQRESRWIELSLDLLAPETSVGFDQALDRAERVQALKQAIAKEREARESRRSSGREKDTTSDIRSEEEFYEHLR